MVSRIAISARADSRDVLVAVSEIATARAVAAAWDPEEAGREGRQASLDPAEEELADTEMTAEGSQDEPVSVRTVRDNSVR
jgi:hypothetical protein